MTIYDEISDMHDEAQERLKERHSLTLAYCLASMRHSLYQTGESWITKIKARSELMINEEPFRFEDCFSTKMEIPNDPIRYPITDMYGQIDKLSEAPTKPILLFGTNRSRYRKRGEIIEAKLPHPLTDLFNSTNYLEGDIVVTQNLLDPSAPKMVIKQKKPNPNNSTQ